MSFISITRLRVRSIRFLPFFVLSMWGASGRSKLDLLDDDRLGQPGEYAALHDDGRS
jgi:hypothetical protein